MRTKVKVFVWVSVQTLIKIVEDCFCFFPHHIVKHPLRSCCSYGSKVKRLAVRYTKLLYYFDGSV